MERFKGNVPEIVKRAIARDDKACLSATGRKGGSVSAQRRREDALYLELLEQERLDDARRHEAQLYGDCPPQDD
jgi:hypothetical protein